MRWTADKVSMLRRLWNEGLSAGEIAVRMDIKSRSSILGKVDRLRKSGMFMRADNGKPQHVETVEQQKAADQISLHILQRREWDASTFSTIGNEIGRTGRSASGEYTIILRDLAESEGNDPT